MILVPEDDFAAVIIANRMKVDGMLEACEKLAAIFLQKG
jgi:hypothetical protein